VLHDEGVDDQVGEQDQESEDELNLAGEAGGVDDRQQVVLDEAARIARGAGEAPELVFERGEGTETARDLDEHSPDCRWKVEQAEPPAVEGEQTAEDDELDDGEVGDDEEVREGAMDHGRRTLLELDRKA
jgi:hypothetical protein